jgi:hypothetical protein
MKNKNKNCQPNKNEELFELFKFLSIIPLIVTIFLEIEILLFFIIKLFSGSILFAIILFLLYHYLLLHFGIECFLYFIQFPFIGKASLYSNGCVQANHLILALSTFIDICEKIVDNEKISLCEEYSNLLDIYEGMNYFIYLYYEMKKKYGLSKYQKNLYESLVLWRRHFKQYKILQYFKENKRHMEEYVNMEFNKRLVHLIMDSNFIIKIAEDYICYNYKYFSFKKIYNFLFNDTFSSLNQYKVSFNMKFKEKANKFITSDNKIIDFTIIDSQKLVKENTIPFQEVILNKNKNKKNQTEEKKEKESITSFLGRNINLFNSFTDTSSHLSNESNEVNKKRNLIIFCNPNSMIYEFFSPEKYGFYYEGGCDVLFWNYRGYGFSEGHCTFNNNRDDILELFDEIKKMNKWEKFGVHGYSIGGVSATHLARNRNIDLLISDRNFSSIYRISESFFFGKIIKYLCKFILIDRYNNELNYLFTKNSDCCKIILCDPSDEVVANIGSVKSSISKYIIKNCIQKSKYENILDLIFNSNEKNKFINALLNIMDFLEKNCLRRDNLFVQNLNNFFDCFIHSSEDLKNFGNYEYKRLKILYINNFFNNFVVWGSKKCEEDINKFKENFYKIENNKYYLDKAINILGVLINLENELNKIEFNDNAIIMDYIEIIKNGFIQLSNKVNNITFTKDISKGYLIRLNCGHNTIFSGKEEDIIVQILEEINFLN